MLQKRPIIGLTTYERDKEQNYGLPGEYIEAVRRAGGIPVLLPHGESYQDELLNLLDGVILTGGGDVDPAHYEGTAHEALEDVDPERDASEINLAQLIVASELPALHICRGAQVLNVALGGTLIEHLPDEVGDEIEHRTTPPGYTYHAVTVEAGSRLAAIIGEADLTSNSWHHQAVRQLAPGLRAVAFAPDGTVEAVEMPNHPWLIAVQWHPESLAVTDPAHQRIFDALVEAAAQQMKQQKKFRELKKLRPSVPHFP